MEGNTIFHGRIRLILEKQASDLVPFSIVECEKSEEFPASGIDELELLETSDHPPIEIDFKLQTGDRLEFTGDFWAEYSKTWTDGGYEYDVTNWFDNVKDVSVWRIVHSKESL